MKESQTKTEQRHSSPWPYGTYIPVGGDRKMAKVQQRPIHSRLKKCRDGKGWLAVAIFIETKKDLSKWHVNRDPCEVSTLSGERAFQTQETTNDRSRGAKTVGAVQVTAQKPVGLERRLRWRSSRRWGGEITGKIMQWVLTASGMSSECLKLERDMIWLTF